MWRWPDPIYGITYECYIGPWKKFLTIARKETEEVKTWVGPQGSLHDFEDEPGAITIVHNQDSFRVVFWFPFRMTTAPLGQSTIAHEAMHATIAVLTNRGIVLNTIEAEEAAAYYIGWLVDSINKCVLEKHQRGKKGKK